MDCTLPESDADALVILNAIYPNRYVWDDTHLTVAVQAAPNVSDGARRRRPGTRSRAGATS